VDGDTLRTGLCAGLGFSPEDRDENVRRVGEAALLAAEAGLVALAALISPYAVGRAGVRARCTSTRVPFIEV
jgi:bifunctional enzyme CysN/CysC